MRSGIIVLLVAAACSTPAHAQEASGGASARACEGGDAAACMSVARAHALGIGVPIDRTTEARWLERACALGAADGCYRLAVRHAAGRWVVRDALLAAALFDRACQLGSSLACGVVERAQAGARERTRVRQLALAPTGDEAVDHTGRDVGVAIGIGLGVAGIVASVVALASSDVRWGPDLGLGGGWIHF